MTRRLWPLLALGLFLLARVAPAGEVPKVGDAVWAQWLPNDWYHGQADKKCSIGLHVAFDDGDQADRPLGLIVVDRAPKKEDVKVGTHLLARWTGGKVYPGTVQRVTPAGKYAIQFDDGDSATVGLEDLRPFPSGTRSAKPAAVGDTVWAQWLPNAWYHGKVDKKGAAGLHVTFDDGDQADRPLGLIVVDRAPNKEDVKVGTHLLAIWTDGKVYPGTVTRVIAGGKYAIQFDDGDSATVGLDDLRLRAE
jgi:hypothetical protein